MIKFENTFVNYWVYIAISISVLAKMVEIMVRIGKRARDEECHGIRFIPMGPKKVKFEFLISIIMGPLEFILYLLKILIANLKFTLLMAIGMVGNLSVVILELQAIGLVAIQKYITGALIVLTESIGALILIGGAKKTRDSEGESYSNERKNFSSILISVVLYIILFAVFVFDFLLGVNYINIQVEVYGAGNVKTIFGYIIPVISIGAPFFFSTLASKYGPISPEGFNFSIMLDNLGEGIKALFILVSLIIFCPYAIFSLIEKIIVPDWNKVKIGKQGV